MTEPTLVAALLHDTVEDTPYTLDAAARATSATRSPLLVDGVTKLDKVKYGDSAQAETIRKMIVAMAATSGCWSSSSPTGCTTCARCATLKQATQERKARETLEIYAPLAHRLGMNTIKWELEDLAFATLHPKIYDEIVRLVAERAPSRDQFLAEVDRPGRERPARAPRSRRRSPAGPKHYYSIYQKMIVARPRVHRHLRPGRHPDPGRGRTATATPRSACCTPAGTRCPGRFKDYVAMPKFNMYQSLHTTVIGPQGKPVEMQIRTYAMHRRAEYGVAAHWKYKEDGRAGVDTERARRPRRHDLGAPAARLAERGRGPGRVPRVAALRDQPRRGLRLHPARRRDRAAGRRRRRSTSPTPSTPRSGTTRIGARVNGRLVPLESTLDNGDVVEVFTSKAPNAGAVAATG